MKKRMIAAFLVGALILSPGCYPWASGSDRQRTAVLPEYAEARRIAESRRPWTNAERGKLYKGIGGAATAAGAACWVIYLPFAGLYAMGAPEEEQESYQTNTEGLRRWGLGLLAVGGLLWLYGDALDDSSSKRTQLQFAPNGCRFTYRF